MIFTIETEQETDTRWIAEILELAGVLAYGTTVDEAIARAKALALRVLAERLEHGEEPSALTTIAFEAVSV
ncbi:MAG: type II toxin-antitoxin system HicB family antitoxin [Chloroflexales bacterium]